MARLSKERIAESRETQRRVVFPDSHIVNLLDTIAALESELKLEHAAALREAAAACEESDAPGAKFLAAKVRALIPSAAASALNAREEAAWQLGQRFGSGERTLETANACDALDKLLAEARKPLIKALTQIIEVRGERDKVLMVAESAILAALRTAPRDSGEAALQTNRNSDEYHDTKHDELG